MADYLVTGSTILNDIVYADGTKKCGFLGGTLYAVNGIKTYTDSVLFISPAGPDFDSYYGDYFRANGLSAEGMELILPKTQYNVVEYNAGGQWWEHSVYGEAYVDEVGTDPLVKTEYVVKHSSEDTKGIYFESTCGEDVWDGLCEIRKAARNAVILAELSSVDIEDHKLHGKVFGLIEKVDMYSVNLPESMELFGTSSGEESIKRIIEIGKPCFFRVGNKGSYMIEDGRAWFAPMVGASVDSTGCGNCSTGAALYGYCEKKHPLMTAVMANHAAGLNAAQVGPYPLYTKEVREETVRSSEKMFAELNNVY